MSELKRGLFPRRRKRTTVLADESESIQTEKRRRSPLRRKKSKKKRKRKKRRLTLAVLPTMLTLGNAVCGLGAIAIAISNDFPWPEHQMFVAGLLIFGGMLFDALDGSAARMTGQESKFGAELDSLCDAVTFGTAPAVMIWQMSDVFPQRFTWGIGVLFTLCVLIRLARFNVETDEDDTHEGFEGLPSPAAAGTIAAFAIALPDLAAIAADAQYPDRIREIAAYCESGSQFLIPALALALAYLMVSRYQYPHIIQQWVRGRRALHQVGQGLFAVFGVFLLHWLALPMIFSYYAFASPVRTLLRSGNRPSEQNDEAKSAPRRIPTQAIESSDDPSNERADDAAITDGTDLRIKSPAPESSSDTA